MALLSEALTQILIPAAALLGIGFALLQWFLVSRVKVSVDSNSVNNGFSDRLIEDEEEGNDSLEVSIKCAEIQTAISVGQLSFFFLFVSFLFLCLISTSMFFALRSLSHSDCVIEFLSF